MTDILTDNRLLFGIIMFYSVLLVFLTFYGYSQYTISFNTAGIGEDLTLLNFWGRIGLFFQMLSFGVSGLPWWFASLLFTPVALMLTYLLVKLARGI